MPAKRETIYDTLGRESVHPFPARMAPGLALEAVSGQGSSLRVLDPMMGSGTVLALARLEGHRAIGCDIDPLAVLISRVWTTSIDPESVLKRAEQVLLRARDRFCRIRCRDAYPQGADGETRKFVAYWFDDYARRQLAALAQAIRSVRDGVIRSVLWCAFSRLIIAKQAGVSLAMDLSHSRPHRAFERAPTKPFQRFIAAAERVVENCLDRSSAGRGPAARTFEGDARRLPLGAGSVDLVLTSPPYLNAIDYMRCSKFSLVWMGYSIRRLRQIRSESIGSEVGGRFPRFASDVREIVQSLDLQPKLPPREEAVLSRYVSDIMASFSEIARVLLPGGRAVLVVGENTVRGTYVPNSEVVRLSATRSGLVPVDRSERMLPPDRRYLPPPSGSGRDAPLDARVRKEVVLSFVRPK